MSAPRLSPVPTVPVDRRGALRHSVEVEGVVSGATASPITVLLTDISEHGCQIARPAELIGGESLRLSFAGFAPFDATVVWTSGRAAGLRFDYPAHAALIRQVVAAAKGRKRPPRLLAPELVRREERERLWHLRLPVTIKVVLASGARAIAIAGTLSDLSTEGCRIVAAATPLPDAAIAIQIEGRPAIAAQVRWCVAGALGVQFAEPLTPALLAELSHRAGTAAAQPS